MDLEGPALTRILQRASYEWNAELLRATDAPDQWLVRFLPEDDDDATREASFAFDRDDQGRIVIQCDAPWDEADTAGYAMLARFHRDLATRFRREDITFDDYHDVAGYLVEHIKGRIKEDFVVLAHRDAPGALVYVTPIRVAREPWVFAYIKVADRDAIDPEWALEHNASLAYASLSFVGDRCDLGYSFPLAGLSAARLHEVIDDLVMLRSGLLTRLVDDQSEEGGPLDEDASTADSDESDDESDDERDDDA